MTQATPFPRHIESANAFQKVGFVMLLMYLFVMYSRLFDVILSSFEIPFIVTTLVLAASLFSGGFQRAFQSPVGKVLLMFTLWMGICVPFSIWKGGSFPFFQFYLKAAISFVYVAGLIDSHKQIVRSIYAIAFAVVVLSVVALLRGSMDSGRLFLAEGKFQNPNDLANTLLLGLPFIWLVLKNSTQNVLFKIPPMILAVVVLYTMTKTGSRGALIGFVVVLLFVFFAANSGDKLVIAVAALLVLLIGAFVMPSSLRSRYVTFFAADEETTMSESAITSSAARTELAKRSFLMTLQHPLFGVGPGMFSEANQQEMMAQGIHTADVVTHNSYTTVSSEMGLPGIILYVALISMSLRLATKVHKLTRVRKSKYWASVANTAFCMRMSLIVYAVTSAFATVAYQSTLPTLAGLTVALYVTTMRDLASEDAQNVYAGNHAAQRAQPLSASRRFADAGWQRT